MKRVFLLIVFVFFMLSSISVLANPENKSDSNIEYWDMGAQLNHKWLQIMMGIDRDSYELSVKAREFTERLDYNVSWDNKNNSVSFASEDIIIIAGIGENFCFVNNEKIFLRDPLYIHENCTYLPQSFIERIFKISLSIGYHERFPEEITAINGIDFFTQEYRENYYKKHKIRL